MGWNGIATSSLFYCMALSCPPHNQHEREAADGSGQDDQDEEEDELKRDDDDSGGNVQAERALEMVCGARARSFWRRVAWKRETLLPRLKSAQAILPGVETLYRLSGVCSLAIFAPARRSGTSSPATTALLSRCGAWQGKCSSSSRTRPTLTCSRECTMDGRRCARAAVYIRIMV